jgi:predicted chitinase
MIPLLIPFIKIAAVGALLYAGFKLLYNAGWDLGTIFEAIGDNFKSVLLTIQEGFLYLLDKLTFGDANKKIKEAQKGLEVERQALKEKEKARDAQREANKAERAAKDAKEEDTVSSRKAARAKEKEAETSEAARKAKEKETEAVTASTSVPGVNLSSPQAMYDSMVKRQQGGTAGAANPPGATTTAPVTSAATPPPINQDQTKNMELIKAALQKQGITDPKYIAATLGNVMKETGGKSQSENLNYGKTDNTRIRSIFGKRAAGKSDAELDAIKKDPSQMGEMMYGKDTKIGQQMGNNEPGDGFKYRGRGFIQLTGKGNYSAASKAIYGDDRLVVNPDMVNDPTIAADVSAWFMKKGQAGMAKKMGIDTANMTQADANALATSQIAGQDVKKAGGYLGGENLSKVNAYAGQMAGIAGTPAQTVATATPNPKAVNDWAWSVFSGKADGSIVPEQYKSAVNDILKNPPTHWAQAAGKAPTTATAQTPASNVPNTAAVQTAVTPAAAGATTQQAEAARAAAAATDPRRSDRPQTAVAGARQETPESLLASLNTKMDQLIAINRSLKDTNERQLSVQKGIAQSGDLYAAA